MKFLDTEARIQICSAQFFVFCFLFFLFFLFFVFVFVFVFFVVAAIWRNTFNSPDLYCRL